MTDVNPPDLPPPTTTRRDAARDAARDAVRDADRRWPILVVVLVALVFAAVVDRISDDGRSSSAIEVAGPTIPSADSLSNAWYCAIGSSTPDGPTPETIIVTNLGSRAVQASVTVMPGGGGESVTRDFEVAARAQSRVPVADVLATPEPGVVVETFGGVAVVEHEVVGNDDVAVGPCATGPSASWSFAAGTTDRGSQLWLALFNPFGDDAIVDLTFLTDGGFLAPGDLQGIVVPRRTRVMVPLHDSVSRQATVATQVRTRTGRVVAEQATVREAEPKGLSVSLGTPELSTRWSFPVGGVGGGSVVAVANPGASPAQVTVRIRLDGDATLAPQVVVVPSRAAVAVDVGARVPAGLGAWIEVDSASPVVAEQTLGRPPTGVAAAIGVPTTSRRWAFATGRVAADTTDSIVIANRGRRPARVTLRAIGGGSSDVPQRAVRVGPGRRFAFDLDRARSRGGRRDRGGCDATRRRGPSERRRHLGHRQSGDPRAGSRGDTMIERALIAAAIVVVAIGVAAIIRRRKPEGPPVDSFPTPRQLRRGDFPRPDAPWLVALFSSTTCGSCPDLAAKIAPLDTPQVAVAELTYQDDREIHDRYGISAVPMVVVADAEGVVRAAFVGPTSATDIWAAVAELRA